MLVESSLRLRIAITIDYLRVIFGLHSACSLNCLGCFSYLYLYFFDLDCFFNLVQHHGWLSNSFPN